ncbi:MAG: DUF2922 domain-containing protein [Firmicutes bacterium]|nr:DUF2922 domain-containing protein [Bacillota bacterium]
METKQLVLIFLNEAGRSVRITIRNPRAELDSAAIAAVMDQVVTAGVLSSSGGMLASKRSAQIVDQNTQLFDYTAGT